MLMRDDFLTRASSASSPEDEDLLDQTKNAIFKL